MRVLVTGGAGFIGSHVCDELLAHGYTVRVADSLDPQVHQKPYSTVPKHFPSGAEFRYVSMLERDELRFALRDVDAVIHLAAAVGVGQSMYEIARYTNVNAMGTAVLLEEMIRAQIKNLVVASSMSIYGEGPLGQSDKGFFPLLTDEWNSPNLRSIYALTKYAQERMCLITGHAYGIRTAALRFFNTYGPRQALSNPYTGVLAIFASRLLNGKRPIVFEDGQQSRDFVHVTDVARACRLALLQPNADGLAINIGTGVATTIEQVARKLAAALGHPELEPEITGKRRAGDIRHCFADISLAEKVLGYEPQVPFERGIEGYAAWLKSQQAEDHLPEAIAELDSRGLVAKA